MISILSVLVEAIAFSNKEHYVRLEKNTSKELLKFLKDLEEKESLTEKDKNNRDAIFEIFSLYGEEDKLAGYKFFSG